MIKSIALAAVLGLATVSQASAAVSYQVNGVSGQACYASSAAWAFYKAAQETGGIQSGTLTALPEDHPFSVKCANERKARQAANEASISSQ